LSNPAAGKWKVVIDAYRLPLGKVSVVYQDLVTHSDYGTIRKLTQSSARRVTFERWTERIRIERSKAPPTGRYLVGWIVVANEMEDVIGVNSKVNNPRNLGEGVTVADVRGRVSLGTAMVKLKRTNGNAQ
jgi:hypothetical protein